MAARTSLLHSPSAGHVGHVPNDAAKPGAILTNSVSEAVLRSSSLSDQLHRGELILKNADVDDDSS